MLPFNSVNSIIHQSNEDPLKPEQLGGLLWKKCPSPYSFGLHQRRYVELSDGQMSWSLINGELGQGTQRGFVDFGGSSCSVELVEGSDVKFDIKPKGDCWSDGGNFTGSDGGTRVLSFDSSDSDYDRRRWITCIQAHMAWGEAQAKIPSALKSKKKKVHPAAAKGVMRSDRRVTNYFGGDEEMDDEEEILRVHSPIFSGPPLSKDTKQALTAENFSLARHCLERWPAEKLAVRTRGRNMASELREYAYGEVRAAAYFASNLLADNGICKGDKVLLLQWNSWECITAYFGTHYLGAVAIVVIPVHHERKYLIKYTACKAIAAPTSVLAPLQQEIDDRTYVKALLLTDIQPSEAGSLAGVGKVVPCTRDKTFLDDRFDQRADDDSYVLLEYDGSGRADKLNDKARQEFDSIKREDEALWYFTSGTTGKPKGCVHKQIDLAFAAETYGPLMGCKEGALTATDVLMAGPYAMGSNLIFPFAAGGCIFLDHVDKTNFEGLPTSSFPRIRAAEPEIFVTIPGTIANLANSIMSGDKELIAALGNVKIITSAGAPLPPSTFCNFNFAAKSKGLAIDVLDGIGTSELQHIFITNVTGGIKSDEGSIGVVVEGYEVCLRNALPVGKDGKDWKGELMVRTQLPEIDVHYSNARAPKGYDYRHATQEVNVAADDGGAPWYVTGDIAMTKTEGDVVYFYLLGRTNDLATQIGGGGSRGMGIEDYERRKVATDIMFAVGLFEKSAEISSAFGKGGELAVLADDVYPLPINWRGSTFSVFVVSVSPVFWPPDESVDPNAVKQWVTYVKERIDGNVPVLLFSPADRIPRTAPPLLKPKVGEMKKKVQAWMDRAKPEAIGEALSLSMTTSLKLDTDEKPSEKLRETECQGFDSQLASYGDEMDEEDGTLSPIFAGPRISEDVRKTLAAENFSLARHCLERWPAKRLAVRTAGRNMAGATREYAYGDVRCAAYFAANLLVENGIRKGDKVLLLQWNSWECITAYFGTHYLGAVAIVVIPVHHERKYLVKYTACKAIAAPTSVLGPLQQEIDDRTYVNVLLLTDIQPSEAGSLAGVGKVVPCTGDAASLDDCFDQRAGGDSYVVVEYDGSGRADKLSDKARQEFDSIKREDEALWYFTSGTTGKPKGCVHKQFDLAFAAETYGPLMGCKEGVLTATDVLMAGPYAMGSNLIFPFAAGGCIFLDHVDKTNFEGMPTSSFPQIRAALPEIFVSIPGTISDLAHSIMSGDDELIAALRNLKIITSAGAPLPPSTYCNFNFAAKSKGLAIDVLDGIGTSELQHIFITNKEGNVKSDEGSIGEIVDGYEIRLNDAVPVGKDGKDWKGELMVRTQDPDIVVHYSNARAPKGTDYSIETEEVNLAADDGGAPWYITGDMAMTKTKGDTIYFYLLGRTKDLATQIGGGGSRGMGIEDYERRRVATDLMFAVGLFEKSAAISSAFGKGGKLAVLADDVFPLPIHLSSSTLSVFVISMDPVFWPPDEPADPNALKQWVTYIKEHTDGGIPVLFFCPASRIPRTPPPLLKPKVGEMKNKVQAWMDREKPEAVGEALSLSMTCSLRF